MADLDWRRRPAFLAVLGHRAGEASLFVLHHRSAMIDMFPADGVLDVIAVGIDRLTDLLPVIDERPGRFVELEGWFGSRLGGERCCAGAQNERGGNNDGQTHRLSPLRGDRPYHQ